MDNNSSNCRLDWGATRAVQVQLNQRTLGPTIRWPPPSPALNPHSIRLVAIILVLITVILQIISATQIQQQHIIYDDSNIFNTNDRWPISPSQSIVQARKHHKNIHLIKQLQNIQHHHKQQHLNQPRYNDQSISKILPNGPPPFRPSTLVLGLSTSGALHKLKQTKMFKRMYKSKVYYSFLDVLQQLTILVDKLAKKKLDVTGANMAAIQATVNQLATKGGHWLKLKWPLVMLNPHFIKEILSSPTFLVMLFHAIEVAYTSMPAHFWLKPLVKLVKQPSPEKEEQIWWRRKRFYDTLNGHGTSELEPNLKTMHFKSPGEPSPVSFPTLTSMIRQLAGKPPHPNPHHYKYPVENIIQPDSSIPSYGGDHQTLMENNLMQEQQSPNDLINVATSGDSGDINYNPIYLTNAQEAAFLANQTPHIYKQYATNQQSSPDLEETHEHDVVSASESKTTSKKTTQPAQHDADIDHRTKSDNQQNNQFIPEQEGWLTQLPSKDQLMSQQEFDSLDAHQRELILREARDRFEESRLTNELIKQQNDFVDSFVNRRDDLIIARPVAINGSNQSKTH